MQPIHHTEKVLPRVLVFIPPLVLVILLVLCMTNRIKPIPTHTLSDPESIVVVTDTEGRPINLRILKVEEHGWWIPNDPAQTVAMNKLLEPLPPYPEPVHLRQSPSLIRLHSSRASVASINV
jgi:hypothetical protein